MGAFRAVVVMAFVVACGGGGAPSEEREIADPLLDCDVDQPSGTVTLCQATDSVTTPYVFLHVNEAACVKAHGEHAGDFLSADPRCIPPPRLRQTYVKASNADAFDDFGYAVAISGDTMAVGAPYESSNGDPLDNSVAFSGAVYVFVRSAGSWVQQAYLKPAEPHEPDQFGLSIALDGNTLVAAAPFASTAYVFTRANGVWSQQAELRAGNADPGDGFGCSVGISFDTVVVGAYAESSAGDPLDNSVPSSGAAYVFTRAGSTWSQQAYLKAATPRPYASLGSYVSVSGDRAAISAIGERAADDEGIQQPGVYGATDTGAVYVFE